MFEGARPLFTVAVAANSEQQRETTALQICQGKKKKLSSSNQLSLKCSQRDSANMTEYDNFGSTRQIFNFENVDVSPNSR